MNKQEIIEKVQALMQDAQFKAKLADADSLDDMAALFCNEGIQITGTDLETAYENKDNMELSEDHLENVAGGGGILALACVVFVGGSLLWGYIDGVKNKAKSCNLY